MAAEMKVKEALKALYDDGWTIKTQRGSHIKLEHPTKKGMVTVPNHAGDIPPGTLASIKRQANLKF
jgi:predicted RNA binding protein YcfA (HicA-like mRNA interferase family)